MTLDEAIKHCEEVAETKRQDAEDAEINGCDNFARDCEECANEHRQLAEWLSELKKLREQKKLRAERCKWIKYDYRTICPQNHDVNNPYWRIPENRMDALKYCPYCGKEIEVVE